MSKIPQSSHIRALRLQKKIYQNLLAESKRILGELPPSIQKYAKEAQKDFAPKKTYPMLEKSDLIRSIKASDVTLIADFHTYNQAQKTALRILREAVAPEDSWYIGLELVQSHLQGVLDNYLAGKISLEVFHSLIDYSEAWGFPWANYAPLFEWAKENGVPMLALNRPKSILAQIDDKELYDRDDWAAGLITDVFAAEATQGKRPKILVLYGEHHVSTTHLPARLSAISKVFLGKPLSCITVHQNHDRLFWYFAEKNLSLKAEAVRLKKNVFCVFSGTPWAKLQSLIDWTEGGLVPVNSVADTSTDPSDYDPDYLSIISDYGKIISEFIKRPAPAFESVTAYTIRHSHLMETLVQGGQFTKDELKLFQFHIQNNQRLYIPRVGIIYLGAPSYNRAAELAAIHLFRTITRNQDVFTYESDDIYRLIVEAAFGFFGSLILNPRRKCDSTQNHQVRVKQIKQGMPHTFPFELEARQIALSILLNPEVPNIPKSKKLAPAVMMGARYVGQILGLQIFDRILNNSLPIQDIHQFFRRSQYKDLVSTLKI